MTSLFTDSETFELPDADLRYYPHFIPTIDAAAYFDRMKEALPWQQDDITVFGKTYAQPRLTALFAANGKPYRYSGLTMHPYPFEGDLLEIKSRLEAFTGHRFTTCLANLYRDGHDSNGWHADDEPELGRNPVIASISLGQERYFHLRHKQLKEARHKLLLQTGSLLLMQGAMQHHWQHQIPKTKKTIGARINLTFRIIN